MAINYNTIHKEYRLGMGLYFKIKFGHVEYQEGYTVFSNIPALHMKKFKGESENEIYFQVCAELEELFKI